MALNRSRRFRSSTLVSISVAAVVISGSQVLAVAPATASGSAVTPVPPGVQLGEATNLSFYDRSLTDRQALHVNLADGNLVLQSRELAASGPGPKLDITRTYNSRGTNTLGDLGQQWSFDTGHGVQAIQNGDGSITYTAPTGAVYTFTSNGSGGYNQPHGLNADAALSGGVVTITDRKTMEKRLFRSDGMMTEIDDKNGLKQTFSYNAATAADGKPFLNSVTDTAGRVFTFNHTTYTDGLSDPAGRAVSYSYTGSDLTDAGDATGKHTQYAYDTLHRLTKVTDPLGHQTGIGYDSNNRVTSLVWITNTVTGTGPTYTFAYTDPGSSGGSGTTNVTDANNHTSTYTWDSNYQVTKTTDPLGHSRQQSYTPGGDVATLTDSLSAVTMLTEDNRNNLTKIQAPANGSQSGRTTTFAYADASHPDMPTGQTDAQNHTTTYGYDTAGNAQTTTTAQAAPNQLRNDYQGDGTTACGGKKGQLCKTTDELSHSTSYGYDTQGNVTSITPPSPHGRSTVVPDGLGRTSSVTDGKGQKTSYSYDTDDRITQLLYGGATTCTPTAGTCIQYGYDADGNLTSRTDNTGQTTFVYDQANRPTSKTSPGQAVASQISYDPVGNALTYIDVGGQVSYAYNAANQLTSLAEPGGSCTASPTTKCTTFDVDFNGKRTGIHYPNSTNVVLGYDSSGRETHMQANSPSGAAFSKRDYTYSVGGKDTDLRQTMSDLSVTNTYTYDAVNRLVNSVDATSTANSYAYGYDAAGNRTSSGGGAHTYNAANEFTDTGMAYDANGNQTAHPNFSFTYNVKNQTASETAGSTVINSTYADADSTERTQAGPAGFTNGLLGVTGQTISGASSYFTRDPNGNLISMRNGTAGSYSSYYYVLDAIGSVVKTTDNTGAVAASYTYSPFGRLVASSGAQAANNPWRFASGYDDGTTFGILKFGTRYYDPVVGRWMQQDPIAGAITDPRTINRYPYAGNDPINNSDPTGRSLAQRCAATGLLVGGTAGVFGLLGGPETAIAGAAGGFITGAGGCLIANAFPN